MDGDGQPHPRLGVPEPAAQVVPGADPGTQVLTRPVHGHLEAGVVLHYNYITFPARCTPPALHKAGISELAEQTPSIIAINMF